MKKLFIFSILLLPMGGAYAAGYYGSSTNGTSGCSKCTSHNSVAATSSAGSTARTSCYISSSSSWSFSDTKGSGTAKYTSNCYYSN